MNITILGAGHGGTTVAADLTLKGHRVTLVKTSTVMHEKHFAMLKQTKTVYVNENGKTKKAKLYDVTNDLEHSIADTDLIIIYIQTNYHEQLIERLVPYLKGNEVILFEPGYLGSAYLMKHMPDNIFTCIEAESSPIDCRIADFGHVDVLFRNVRNPVSIYPKWQTSKGQQVLDRLGFPFSYRTSIFETAFYNPNLIVHTVGAIMSAPRIEFTNGEYWMYKEVFTSSVWNLVNALDQEKMNVLKALKFDKCLSYVETCAFRNSVDFISDPMKVFRNYANNNSPKGPASIKTRFITEDVSQGLVLLESVGKKLNVPTPITTSLIDIAGALTCKNYRINGRSIENIGYDIFKLI